MKKEKIPNPRLPVMEFICVIDHDRRAAGDDDEDRCDKHDCEVVADLPAQRPVPGHTPDVIKGKLDVFEHLDYRPQEHDDADSGKQTAFCAVQETAGKLNDIHHHLLVIGHIFHETLLQKFLETESLGNGKGHGSNRDNGHEGEEGERR